MTFILNSLPFGMKHLEPMISATTLEYHHGKHHKAYIEKVNAFLEGQGRDDLDLVDLITLARETGDKPLFNNAAQIWNHNFFWLGLSPTSPPPSGELARRIGSDFGSHAAMLEALTAEALAHFGSGWAWLVLDGDKLKITSYHDADLPFLHGLKPLLTVDVWEHAYYIDYFNARPTFVQRLLSNVINWDFVAENLDGNGMMRANQAQS